MEIIEILEEKKQGKELEKEEIEFIIYSLLSKKISEEKMVELMRLINTSNFSYRETYYLADAMAKSGKYFTPDEIGFAVDKHSAGIASDASTLIFLSVLASLGVRTIKGISSDYGDFRNSLERLNSFDGFNAKINREKIVKNLNEIGCAVFDESQEFAPADIMTYKLRRRFKINSAPLVAASILSKKIASGASVVVYDVKTGEGAISPEAGYSQTLAEYLVRSSELAGIKAAAVISDLNQPISATIGSRVELEEVVSALTTKEPMFDEGLLAVSRELVIMALILAGKADGRGEAAEMFDKSILSGEALKTFQQFVESYGGNYGQIDKQQSITSGVATSYLTSDEDGYIHDVYLRGLIDGYNNLADGIKGGDKQVGVVLLKREGAKVVRGEKIVRIYYSFDNKNFAKARKLLMDSITITKSKPSPSKILYKVVV